jgi:DNA invertase Pin-like site-specific DNA recombinase
MTKKGKRKVRQPDNLAVAYYRVSRQRQGESGLGLEAQRHDVERYARANGLKVVAEYQEVETGTSKRERVEIHKAIDETKRRGARLLIAKLDRLSRNVGFTSALNESGVKFTAVDMPNASELIINIMAAFAQEEARQISKRTKDALAAAKRRGVKLGKPENLTIEAQHKGGAVTKALAREHYRTIFGYIKMMKKQGYSYRRIANRLNGDGYRTRQGKPFQPMTVYRIVQRNGGV